MANVEEKLTKTPEQKTCAHTVEGSGVVVMTMGNNFTLKERVEKKKSSESSEKPIIPFKNYKGCGNSGGADGVRLCFL
jgi:hypothetical protein